MQDVRWTIPSLVDTSVYDETRILRSNAEQGRYESIANIKTVDDDGSPITSFTDDTAEHDCKFYIVRFFSTASKKEYPDFELGFPPLSPREKRLVTTAREWVPDVIDPEMSDHSMGTMLQLSMNAFNVQPPETYFLIDNFPKRYEHFLIYGMEINILILKQVRLGIRDFSYSDMGFQLTIDRDAKMKSALEALKDMYWAHMALGKINFTHMGLGLGTVPLPISFGGQMSSSMLNMLDIFTAMGR